MAWRYCTCGAAQDRITLEEIASAVFYGGKVTCDHCKDDRDDDTTDARFAILIEEVMELRAAVKRGP